MSNEHHKAPNPYGGHTKSIAEQTRGKKYRVRNDGKEPPKVWGKDLTFEQAHALKEKTAGARKSHNLVIESMDVPYELPSHSREGRLALLNAPQALAPGFVMEPPTDPQLRAQYDAGMAAARSAAAEANTRAEAVQAKLRTSAPPAVAEVDLEAATGAVIDDSELSDLMESDGAMPSDEEIADAGDP